MGMKNLPIDKKKAVLYFLLLTFSFILEKLFILFILEELLTLKEEKNNKVGKFCYFYEFGYPW